MKTNNVFDGPDAVERFLSPENMAPLVLLPRELNPFHADGVKIYAKVYGATHVKMVTAYGMLQDAKVSGKLNGVHTLVEASSGNTIDALDFLKRFYGIKKLVAVVPFDLAGGKLDAIRLRGMGIEFHTGDGIAKAIELGKQKGWLNLNQYANPANPAAHKKWTGRHIFEQTEGLVSVVGVGLGTTGTGVGTSQELRERLGKDRITMVAAVCAPGTMIPGVRSIEGLKDISFDWRPWFDDIRDVTTVEAYTMSRNMFINGIMGGPSSGFALAALLKFLEHEKAGNKLDLHRRGPNNEVIAVFICPDLQHVYQEKYLTHMRLSDWKSGN